METVGGDMRILEGFKPSQNFMECRSFGKNLSLPGTGLALSANVKKKSLSRAASPAGGHERGSEERGK
jgi:hypothetical protein